MGSHSFAISSNEASSSSENIRTRRSLAAISTGSFKLGISFLRREDDDRLVSRLDLMLRAGIQHVGMLLAALALAGLLEFARDELIDVTGIAAQHVLDPQLARRMDQPDEDPAFLV